MSGASLAKYLEWYISQSKCPELHWRSIWNGIFPKVNALNFIGEVFGMVYKVNVRSFIGEVFGMVYFLE